MNVALQHGAATPLVQSLIAAIDTLELLMVVWKSCVQPGDLRAKDVYGEASFSPKHDYAYHLWLQLAIFGILISCPHSERIHEIPKSYIMNRRNTISYELGAIEDSCKYRVGQLNDTQHYRFASSRTLLMCAYVGNGLHFSR